MKGFTIHSRSRFTGVTWGEANFGLPYFGVENFGFGDFKGDLFIGDLKRCVSTSSRNYKSLKLPYQTFLVAKIRIMVVVGVASKVTPCSDFYDKSLRSL